MKTITLATALLFALTLAASAQHSPAGMDAHASGDMAQHEAHAAVAPVTYEDLKNTLAQLDRARQATAKYQDVHVAEADGYHQVGPDFPGMGVHFVQTLEPKEFDIEKPPILLYQKKPDAPGGYSLVGVVYLFNAAPGQDGQPVNPPFPKSLVRWHRHANLCLAPGLANPHGLTESQCRDQGGHFLAESPWMTHAWIWKDSPTGVFSSENAALGNGSVSSKLTH